MTYIFLNFLKIFFVFKLFFPNKKFKSKNVIEGDYIVEIDDQDVRWLKHSQVVEKFRGKTMIKLTLVRVRPITNEHTFIINEYMRRVAQKNYKSHQHIARNNHDRYSTNFANYVQPVIRFNEEDDEINPTNRRSKRTSGNHRFMNSLKMLSFANTITFGRKFKKIISLKLKKYF